MTREEAIDILRSYLMFDKSNMQIDIALNMAIEALSAEHKHCWDCKHYEPKYNVCHAPEVVKQVTSKSAEEYEDYEHATLVDIKEPLKVLVVRCKDCYWYDKGENDCDSWQWCKRHRFDSYDEGFCSWATPKKQVTGKLKKLWDSLLTEDSEERKEQKSKLGLIRREDAIDAIDDAIDPDSPQWAILRTKIGFLPEVKTELVRCKDCRHHGMSACPMWEGSITDDYMWCYFGERREE